MDIGKHNETIFYDGFEGEGEIILSIPDPNETVKIHVWEGYFEDIFGNPIETVPEWIGFTKDYQESIRTFDGEEYILPTSIPEYLSDLNMYKDRTFSYPETKECLKLLISFFEAAITRFSGINVTVF